VIEADFRQDILKAGPPLRRLAAVSLVPVDDLDTIAGPAEGDGYVGPGLLACARFLVLRDLLGT
jgi:hypothetical protein